MVIVRVIPDTESRISRRMEVLCRKLSAQAVVGEVADVTRGVGDVSQIPERIVGIQGGRRRSFIFLINFDEVVERIADVVTNFSDGINLGIRPAVVSVRRDADRIGDGQRTLQRIVGVGRVQRA